MAPNDDAAQAVQSDDDADARRVAIACDAIVKTGAYPTVESVATYMRQHLGGGIRLLKVSGYIRQWEQANRTSKRAAKLASIAADPPPSLDALLDGNTDLVPVIEAMTAALAQYVERRQRREGEERKLAIRQTEELERDQAALRLQQREAELLSEIEELQRALDAQRDQEASLTDRIDQQEETIRVLRSDIEVQRSGWSMEKAEHEETKERLRQITADRDDQKKLVAQERKRAGDAEKQVADLQQRLETALAQAAVAEESRKQVSALVDALRGDVQAERARTDTLHQQVVDLTAKLAAKQGE